MLNVNTVYQNAKAVVGVIKGSYRFQKAVNRSAKTVLSPKEYVLFRTGLLIFFPEGMEAVRKVMKWSLDSTDPDTNMEERLRGIYYPLKNLRNAEGEFFIGEDDPMIEDLVALKINSYQQLVNGELDGVLEEEEDEDMEEFRIH